MTAKKIVVSEALQRERDSVFALAQERACNLEESAHLLRAAVREGAIARIVALSRSFDNELSTRAAALHKQLNGAPTFTPLNEAGQRMRLDDGEVRWLQGTQRRGPGLHGVVEIYGKRYEVHGRRCRLIPFGSGSGCYCDIQLKAVQ